MKTHSFIKILFAVLISIAMASCSSSKPKTQGEVLQAMNMNQNTFSKFPVCQQIRIYTDFGMNFLDRGHMVALVPSWMDDAINSQPKNDVANCISQEGFYRLSLLGGGLNSREDVSLAIHTLIYKAEQLKLLNYPQIQDLLNMAICKNDLDYEYEITLIYYLSKNGKIPDYAMKDNSTERMQAELCNK